ncbi:hypothetical protein AVEN_72544-1, partial [Araneus ventricosus]
MNHQPSGYVSCCPLAHSVLRIRVRDDHPLFCGQLLLPVGIQP